jgi:outer membrane receptor for ferrienterochelin and colicins
MPPAIAPRVPGVTSRQMGASRAATLIVTTAFAVTSPWIGDAAADDAPAVDVEDLPPLPPPTEGDAAGHVSEVAAAAAEEDVVVGAAKREQSLGNVASAVTVISGDRLRRFGYRTVSEAIRGVAGVFVADDHMSERVGIRGLQPLGDFNTRILVLVDGATVTEPWAQFAGVGWDCPVDIDDVARIEVIRGPVSSLYGTNAFFGIINIVTRGADQAPKLWGRIGGSSFAGAQASAGFATGGVHRQLRGSVAALYRAGETLSVPDIGDDLGHDSIQGFNASLVGSYGGWFGQVRAYRRIRDLTFYPYLTTVDTDGNNNTDEQLMLEGGYTHAVSDTITLTGRLYANRYRFSDYLRYDTDPTDPSTLDVFRDFGDAWWTGAEARARWEVLPDGRLGVTAGGELTLIRARSHSFDVGTHTDAIVTPMNVEGLYAEADSHPLPWVSVTAGFRYDRNNTFENRPSPRLALFFSNKDRYGLKLLYAAGFRNPSPFEGFFSDGMSYEANPDLRAETIASYEAVAWGRWRGLSARLSGFDWDAERIIEQNVDPASPPDMPLLQFQNSGTRSSKGVEGEASYRDARGWLAFGGFVVEKVRDERKKRVPGAPWLTVSGGVSSPQLAGLLHVSSELELIGPRPTRDDSVSAATFVGWNVAVYVPDWHGFDLTVGVRNLLGRREELPAQEDYDRDDALVPLLPGEGREFDARLGRRF